MMNCQIQYWTLKWNESDRIKTKMTCDKHTIKIIMGSFA